MIHHLLRIGFPKGGGLFFFCLRGFPFRKSMLNYKKRSFQEMRMGKCIVFCAASFDTLAREIESGDYIIAADGGLRHTQRLGIVPDEILGDFDSLGYCPENAHVFPVEKEDTDTLLALRRGLELGFDAFVLYGAMDGPRLDHTIANLQSLLFLAEQGAQGILVGCRQMATVVKNGTLSFAAGKSGTVSLFCPEAQALGVTLTGLYYPLTRGTLRAGFPLGVSNQFTGEAVHISVEQGSLLVLWDRDQGFPEHW